MPDDTDSINFDDRLEKVEDAVLDDVKEIKALKAEIAGLRENLRDVLRILGVAFGGSPFVKPQEHLQAEQTKDYYEALKETAGTIF